MQYAMLRYARIIGASFERSLIKVNIKSSLFLVKYSEEFLSLLEKAVVNDSTASLYRIDFLKTAPNLMQTGMYLLLL